MSKTYHNVTARYNSYFLAREKMQAAEEMLLKARQDDYNEVLPVLLTPSEKTINTTGAAMEEIVRKASIPVQRHRNSQWVDDCYILIGQARYYQLDFENAIPTLKYVNTKSEDPAARHRSLIWLMRAYMLAEQPGNMRAVADYLIKQPLSPDNQREFYLTMAQHHHDLREYNLMGEYMKLAVPLLEERDRTSRMNFILAQILQGQGNDADAYAHYEQVLKLNPPYELSFFTKLNMAQVTQLGETDDVKQVEKYFRKLLRDQKNLEYQDRIYYEMARFELKRDQLPPALDYLRQSVAVEGGNPTQKAYSYLQLGEIYYDRLKDFATAKAYYDSTLQFLNENHYRYEGIARRQAVLEDFVAQLNVVEREDSLQRLAGLDSTALYAFLDRYIAREDSVAAAEAKALAKAERQQRRANTFDNAVGGFGTDQSSGSNWYFYNQAAISRGRSEFTRQWGNRTLEDHWRRRQKTAIITTATDEEPLSEATATAAPEAADTLSAGERRSQRRSELLADIPRTEAQLVASNERLAGGLYALGKIYDQRLRERPNAAKAFDRFAAEFPDHEDEPEVLYYLTLIYRSLEAPDKALVYQRRLQSVYPNSTYARKLDNPNFEEESRAADRAVSARYAEAYDYYRAGKYDTVPALVDRVRADYPFTQYLDKITMLEILAMGQLDTVAVFRDTLQGFITAYPTSELVPYAEQLLGIAESKLLPPDTGTAANPPPPLPPAGAAASSVVFNDDLKQPHFYVAVYNLPNSQSQDITLAYSDYNRQQFAERNLKTSSLMLSDTSFAVVVKQFATSAQASMYLTALEAPGAPAEAYRKFGQQFVITTQNFPTWYQAKDTESYLLFFRENYNRERNAGP